MATRARDDRPVRRVVQDADGREYVVEIGARMVRIRPVRTRRGGPAEYTRTWNQIYLDAACGGPLASRPRRKGRQ